MFDLGIGHRVMAGPRRQSGSGIRVEIRPNTGNSRGVPGIFMAWHGC
jgi:hypothetical protein